MSNNVEKKGFKGLLFYVSFILIFTSVIYITIQSGKSLEITKMLSINSDNNTSDFIQHFLDTIHHNLTHPVAILLLQIITIIFTARTLGFLFNKIGCIIVSIGR